MSDLGIELLGLGLGRVRDRDRDRVRVRFVFYSLNFSFRVRVRVRVREATRPVRTMYRYPNNLALPWRANATEPRKAMEIIVLPQKKNSRNVGQKSLMEKNAKFKR